MKTIFFFLASIFIIPVSYANSKDSLENIDTKKHEVGLILNPVGIVLLGAAPSGQRIGISYKHQLKATDLYFTSGLYYQGRNGRGFNLENEITLEVNGLLRNVQYNIESTNKVIGSLGIEKRWLVNTCPKIITYLGAEVLMAYGTVNNSIGNQWMKSDSVTIAEIGNQTLQPVSDFKQTMEVNKTIIGGGFQLNAGLQFHLNKRLYLFAQTAPSFLLSSISYKENDYLLNTSKQTKSTNFDLDIRALVSDIGMVFKF